MIFCVSFVKIFVCIKKCRTFAALFPVTSDANQVIGFYFFSYSSIFIVSCFG